VIKLQGWVLEVLKRLRIKTNSKSECSSWGGEAGLIFKTPAGGLIDSDKLAKTFKSILEQASLPAITLYDLRHTGATLALARRRPAQSCF